MHIDDFVIMAQVLRDVKRFETFFPKVLKKEIRESNIAAALP